MTPLTSSERQNLEETASEEFGPGSYSSDGVQVFPVRSPQIDTYEPVSREAEGFSPDSDPENYGYGYGDDFENPQDYPDEYYEETANQSTGGETNEADTGGLRPNPLDRFANYIYSLSLHTMTLDQYNAVANGQNYVSSSKNVLIASGGRRGQELSRNDWFGVDDLYFESLKINTIIGHNARSQASNVVEIDFTVVEPLGMSLIDRLMGVAGENNIKAWDQMPFMLRIDFFANLPNGTTEPAPIDGLTKFINIKIIDMAIKVSTKGTEYKIKAIPNSHVGFLKSAGVTPVNMNVVAKTVAEFFDNSGTAAGIANLGPGGYTTADPDSGFDPRSGAGEFGTGSIGRSAATVSSYAAAINGYQKVMVDYGYHSLPDQYKFEIDPEIAKSKIYVPEFVPLQFHPTQTDINNSAQTDRTKLKLPISYGTSIQEVINFVLRTSDYYRDMKTSSGPLQSHKITCVVEYGPWDQKRNQYQKTIKYRVSKYKYYNTKNPNFPISKPNSVNKKYNYMFSEEGNQHILDVNIDFNTMFYTVLTALKDKGDTDNTQIKKEKDKPDPGEISPAQRLDTLKIGYAPRLYPEGASALSDAHKKAADAVDIYKSMMSSSRGDMLNIQLKIAGDPDFIKQDDIFFPRGVGRSGSIPMDVSEIFVNLYFRVPYDIIQDTGLYGIKDKSVFSGIYKVIAVDNVFERGQFYQTLELIRIFEQETTNVSKSNDSESANDARDSGEQPADLEQGDVKPVEVTMPVSAPVVQPTSGQTAQSQYNPLGTSSDTRQGVLPVPTVPVPTATRSAIVGKLQEVAKNSILPKQIDQQATNEVESAAQKKKFPPWSSLGGR